MTPEPSTPREREVEDARSSERRLALAAVADELESRAFHIAETIKWVRSDRPPVADYLEAVQHGLRLGAKAARSRS